ncbi:hypothetical protein EVAR_76321_1 [Eumeta japonica]|uniref:Uncharacterized protein n=1 Tax=Eumeta variegata TaxID=151549 RepID=A0A4C1T8F4_EUMVA|nr:hypothetical protein EVAR_76321_1 [Eumeta japonica]
MTSRGIEIESETHSRIESVTTARIDGKMYGGFGPESSSSDYDSVCSESPAGPGRRPALLKQMFCLPLN